MFVFACLSVIFLFAHQSFLLFGNGQVSEGSRKLTTTVNTVAEDALRRRGDLAGSIHGKAGIGYDMPFYSAAVAVAGMADRRQTNVFKSSGAQQDGSSVFTSFGVKRLAEVKIVDFDNKKDFVTFNSEFVALLRSYRSNGFSRAKAQQIFRTYGMFVVTRGIFGGFVELRTTMLASDVLNRFYDAEASRLCYENYASIKAITFGFQGNAPSGVEACDADAMDAFEAARRAYVLDTGETDVVGGNAVDGDLVVTPETSTLLTSSDMYPLGDNGLELRPLTDFLSPSVISPLEVKRYQIWEDEFAEIQEYLQIHLREEMVELQGVLDKCGDCEVQYLSQLPDGWGFECNCYEPPPPVSILEPIAGTYNVEIRRQGESYWGWGEHNTATLEIPLYGPLTYDGEKVTKYEYDKESRFLSWKEQGAVDSRVELTFYPVKEDKAFFGDQANNTGVNVCMGAINSGWFGASEIRCFLQED